MTAQDPAESVRPSISSVDARVGRLELRATEQDAVMRLIQQDQTHLREIVSNRFSGVEAQVAAVSAQLAGFIGRIEVLVAKGSEQQADLRASGLGRQIDDRLKGVEGWEQVSRAFHSRVDGLTLALRVMFGTSLLGFVGAAVAIAVAVSR